MDLLGNGMAIGDLKAPLISAASVADRMPAAAWLALKSMIPRLFL